MNALAMSMVQADPAQRPTIDSVVVEFATIRGRLRRFQLNTRLAERDETPLTAFFKDSTSTLRGIVRRASSFF
jgi:hypothetical protein